MDFFPKIFFIVQNTKGFGFKNRTFGIFPRQIGTKMQFLAEIGKPPQGKPVA
jgi:hypothetical protein